MLFAALVIAFIILLYLWIISRDSHKKTYLYDPWDCPHEHTLPDIAAVYRYDKEGNRDLIHVPTRRCIDCGLEIID